MNDTKAAEPALPAEARQVGRQLANVAFDLAQRPGHALTSDDCALLDRLRKQWDHALSASTQAPPTEPADLLTAARKAVLALAHIAVADPTYYADYEALSRAIAAAVAASPAVERDALVTECKRLVDEFGNAVARASLSVTKPNLDAVVAAQNELHASIGRLANQAPGEPT